MVKDKDNYKDLLLELIKKENINSYLERLSEYSVMKRDMNWNLIWWNDYYFPMLEDSCFLDPLISYNIFSASVKGGRKSGIKFHLTEGHSLLESFFTKISKIIAEQANLDKDSTEKHRMEIAEHFARFISYRLMDSVKTNIHSINENNLPTIFQQQYDLFLDMLNNPEAILPDTESLAIKSRDGFMIDPFFMKFESDLFEINQSDNKIYGHDQTANSQKFYYSSVGEYAKTDMGEIPDQLNRLLPTELLLLYKGFKGNSRGKAGALRKQAKAMFLYKAVNSELWQRYSKRLITSRTRPELILQIDFKDDIENHRLLFPPQAPIVSFYRALILEFISKMMILTKSLNWSLDILLNHFLMGKTNSFFFDRKSLPITFVDKKSLFLLFVKKLPDLFCFNIDFNSKNQSLDISQTDYTFWIRLIIGSNEIINRSKNKQAFNSINELGIRIDCLEDYSFGMAFSNLATEADEISIDNYEYCDNPAIAANKIISAISEQKIKGFC